MGRGLRMKEEDYKAHMARAKSASTPKPSKAPTEFSKFLVTTFINGFPKKGKRGKVIAEPTKAQIAARKRKGVPTESQEQAAVIQWCDAHPVAKHIFAIPNGSHKSPAMAAKFKREGLRAGVPDLFLPVPSGGWAGLFVEMKRTKGSVTSKEQWAWIDILTLRDFACVVCKGADEAIAAIKHYLGEV